VLKHTIAFDPAHDAAAFAQVPATGGVFALRGKEGGEPYVSKSSDLRRKIKRLLAPPESQSKRLNLRDRCAVIEFTATGSEFENVVLLYQILRAEFPKTYSQRLRLALSPLVRFHWQNAYPRAYVTKKLGRMDDGPRSDTYYGPFRSRVAADKYLNDTLDLFKSRRCTFELEPDPAFPGCVYSEMKMCLAPCFKGCTDEEYFAETRLAEGFIATRGENLLSAITAERDAASAALEFEKAAALHARYEKVKGLAHQADEIVRRIDKLEAIIIQPSIEDETVALFCFTHGSIRGPATFSLSGMAMANPSSGQSSLHIQPMMFAPTPLHSEQAVVETVPAKPEARLRDAVSSLLSEADKTDPAAHAESLAIIKRWYYRSSRVGEIFFCENGEWPGRRILNGISRVYVSAHKEQNPLNADQPKTKER
jgi:excinuclease ABC subunit C